MRKIMLVAPVVASAALVFLSAGPASAATTTTFAVTAGTLGISDPASVALPSVTAKVGAQSLSGALGAVTVTDDRGGTAAWTAQVVSTDFTFTGGTNVPATAIGYTTPVPTSTGTVTLAAASPANISAAVAVVTASAVSGANTATWNPTINVAVPAGALAGTYSGTITHSVA